jgi:hypothetical protein
MDKRPPTPDQGKRRVLFIDVPLRRRDYVALAVFLTLPLMLVPALMRGRAGAEVANCRSSLKQIGYAISMYLCDHDEEMPPSLEVLATTGHYIDNPSVFVCPASPMEIHKGQRFPSECSYYYAPLVDMENVPDPASVPIAWDKGDWHSSYWRPHPMYVSVLYADLHVEAGYFPNLAKRIEEHAALYRMPPVLPEVVER